MNTLGLARGKVDEGRCGNWEMPVKLNVHGGFLQTTRHVAYEEHAVIFVALGCIRFVDTMLDTEFMIFGVSHQLSHVSRLDVDNHKCNTRTLRCQ